MLPLSTWNLAPRSPFPHHSPSNHARHPATGNVVALMAIETLFLCDMACRTDSRCQVVRCSCPYGITASAYTSLRFVDGFPHPTTLFGTRGTATGNWCASFGTDSVLKCLQQPLPVKLGTPAVLSRRADMAHPLGDTPRAEHSLRDREGRDGGLVIRRLYSHDNHQPRTNTAHLPRSYLPNRTSRAVTPRK